jgi:hypothetical protein
MRRVVGIGAFVLALVLQSSPAQAAGPTRVALDNQPISFAAGAACPFPVVLTPTVSDEVLKLWTDADGNPVRALITGNLVVRTTNLDTGASITQDASGPVDVRYNPDGSQDVTFTGRNIMLLRNPAGLVLLSGHAIGHVDPDGTFRVLEQSGNVVDICAAVA